jgi:hypothetical protein
MPALTVSRPNVTIEEVSSALRQALNPRYNVLSGTAMNWNPLGKPRPDHPNVIVGGTGSARLFRAEVTISQRSGRTVLHVTAGGIGAPVRLLNRFWIARVVQQALRTAPGLIEAG